MTPARVTPSEIAAVSGLTEKHVRRVFSRAVGAGPYVSPEWYGGRLIISQSDRGPVAEFASLPIHIREAFIEQNQLRLPLGGCE